MLTSIRGLSAATLSAGLFLTTAPAFASEADSEAAAVSSELIEAEQVLTEAKSAENEIVLTTEIDRASKPVETAEVNHSSGESEFSLSGNVAFTNDYRFRGVTFTDGGFAVQGGFDISHSSGLYAGTWASNLDEQTVGYGSVEVDVYGGWSGDLTDGLTADVGVLFYLYPDAGPGEFDYVEFYGSLAFAIGPASLTGGVAYSPNQDSLDFGGGQRDNLYLYTDVSFGIPETPLTLNGHLGYTDGVLTYTADSQAFDWSVGVDWALNDTFTASAAYVGVEGDLIGDPFNIFTDDAFVLTLAASF